MVGLCEGRVCIVTGAGRGIGREHSLMLAEQGAKVVVNDLGGSMDGEGHEAGPAPQVVDEIKAMGGEAVANTDDISDWSGAEKLVQQAIDSFGRLDVLVNNASTFDPTPVGQITPDQFDDLVGSNLRAPLFLSQAAAPELAKREGLILNLADIHGLRPLREHAVYSAAKAGLVMLTRSLARELGPAIRVNAVAPGPVLWPEQGVDPALRERIVARTALKRPGSPEDVAKAALFFATAAPFVTGEVLAVDGGRLVGGEDR
jgi:pteridine reductase